jgi:hypothetical protein
MRLMFRVLPFYIHIEELMCLVIDSHRTHLFFRFSILTCPVGDSEIETTDLLSRRRHERTAMTARHKRIETNRRTRDLIRPGKSNIQYNFTSLASDGPVNFRDVVIS